MPDAPGPPEGGARARRQGRRRRPAPHRDGEDRERAPLHPARRRDAAFLLALVHTLFDEESRRPRRRRRAASPGSTRVAALAREFAPKRSPTTAASRRARSGASRARLRGRGVGGVLRPARHLRAGVRHARELGLRPRQHPHRQSRPRRRRDVHHAGGADRRGAAEGEGLRDRPLEEPRQRPAGGRGA